MTSISNFGQTGPYRDLKSSDTITYAMGGVMWSTGVPARPPVALARNIKMYECGWIAVTATLGAWYGATEDGIGEYVDCSMMEALLGSSDRRDTQLTSYAYSGLTTFRQDQSAVRNMCLPGGYYPTEDGYVLMAVTPAIMMKYAQAIGRPDLFSDPRFINFLDITHVADMDATFLEWLGDKGKQDASQEMQDYGVVLTPVNTPADTFNDPHFKERGFWVEIDHPVTGKMTYPGAPIDMPEGGFRINRPAPLLGQHNEEVYEQLGYVKEDLVKFREGGII